MLSRAFPRMFQGVSGGVMEFPWVFRGVSADFRDDPGGFLSIPGLIINPEGAGSLLGLFAQGISSGS